MRGTIGNRKTEGRIVIEHWKNIVGYEGLYQVSDMGRVKRIVGYNCRIERMLQPYLCIRGGYPQVMLSKDGKRKHKQIHHLVLDTFVGPRPTSEHEARHLNGNAQDPWLTNLKWGTRSENVLDAVGHGTYFAPGKDRYGSKHNMAKLIESDIKIIRNLHKQGWSYVKIAQKFNMHSCTISKIIKGKLWRHVDE